MRRNVSSRQAAIVRIVLSQTGITTRNLDQASQAHHSCVRRPSTIPAIDAAERHHGRYFVVDVDFEGQAQMLVRRAWQALRRIEAAETGAAGPMTTPDAVEFAWRVAEFLHRRGLGESSDEFRDKRELTREIVRYERRAAELALAAKQPEETPIPVQPAEHYRSET